MNFRFHIKNFRGRFTILIGLRLFQPLRPEDYQPYTGTAFQLRCPIQHDYEFEQQAQYALADIKAFLTNKNT